MSLNATHATPGLSRLKGNNMECAELVKELAGTLKRIAEGTGINALDMRFEAKTCLENYKKEIKETEMRYRYPK